MEDKSNSLSRVKRHQREKVLRFSIRKYSFGAASVAVAALMFMGANVVSADSPSQNTSSSTTGLASPKDGEQSSEAGQARDENQAEVASEPSANNEAQPAEEKAATVDSSRLSKLVEEVSALLSTDSKHDPSVVSPIKERLQKGKELLDRADAGQGELDSLAEKLEKDLAVLSSSSKEESQPQGSESANKSSSSERSDHKEEGSDRAASASVPEKKPRRSKRALESIPNTVNEGALSDVRYFASVDPSTNKNQKTRNDDPDFTRDKTVIRANYKEENGQKWMVYDVFFNNDGKRMVNHSYQQQYYFQAPFNIMHPSNTVKDLSFTRYKKFDGRRLSDGNIGFQKYGETAFIDKQWEQKPYIFNNDYISLYDPSSGVNRDDQRWYVFKNNLDNSVLNTLTKGKDGKYPKLSYYLGIKVGKESIDYAVHMHAKIRLKDDVTAEEAAKWGRVYAATTTYGNTTNQSYIMGALGARLQTTTEAETYPIKGSSHTKTVGDSLKDTNNPVGDGYITSKSGKDFPSGMNWNWQNNRKPSTDQAGVFTYKVIARYGDGSSSEDANSGSDGTVTLNVRPKKPTITTSLENKKGLTNQQITVNVGSGVPKGSTVKLYDGDIVIGTGTTNGETATVTVTEALPGNSITAETIVNNGGEVKSERSDAVTPTEAPDTQAPTLTITPASQTVTEGEWVTFTVTATDDKKAKLDVSDFITQPKYSNRLTTAQAFVESKGSTDTKQIRKITLKALPEDVGKTHTFTFKATDDAGNQAKPVTFTFTVTAADKTGPTITADGATVTKNEAIQPIPVSAQDNAGGVGLRDKDPILVEGLPEGLTYKDGKITGTPTGNPGTSRVTIKAYDKNGNVTTETIDIVVQAQKDKYNPVGEPLTVNQGQTISDDAVKAKVKNVGPGTLTVQSKPTSTNTAGSAGNAVVKVTYPDGSSEEVTVPVTVKDVTGPTITANGATVTKNEPISPIKVTVADNEGGRGLREKNPVEVTGLPAGLTYKNGQITGTPTGNPGAFKVTIKAYDKDGAVTTKTITITVQDQAAKYNPKGKDQTVSKNAVPAAADSISNKQDLPTNTSYRWKKTPDTSQDGKTVSAVVVVSYPDGSSEEVPVKVKVSDSLAGTVTAPSAVKEKTPVTPTTVVTANKPGSTITTDKPVNGLTVDGEGKLTGTPTVTDWKPDEEERKITIPVKIKNGKDEVTVSVPVTIQRDTDGDGIPDVTDPDDDNDGISDADEKANGTDPKVANSLVATIDLV
ncbi:Rib/alpha-like domain-containing protein, partial [Streptococcus sp. 2106]|uniref:Rib/alpha-like domain-containing protein n=1 Tax=Streptococcus sp. 2106 TaxID=2582642 RepID=UPI001561E45A